VIQYSLRRRFVEGLRRKALIVYLSQRSKKVSDCEKGRVILRLMEAKKERKAHYVSEEREELLNMPCRVNLS